MAFFAIVIRINQDRAALTVQPPFRRFYLEASNLCLHCLQPTYIAFFSPTPDTPAEKISATGLPMSGISRNKNVTANC